MNKVRTGELPWTKLDVLHRMSLDALLAKRGITTLTEAEKVEFNRVWHRGRPWPDSVAGLTRLKKRFTIAPLSNGNIALMTNMAKRAGIPWDAILGAEVVQAYKPQPEAYTRTAEVLGIRPSELCLVAAHNGDLKAARAAGLATAFVPRPTEHGPGQAGDLDPSEAWDAVGRDFQDLAAKLGC